MIFVIIINILLIIWIYKKYIYIPQINDGSSKEIEELDPALIGYIDDKNGNSIDWILSEILDLNRKDYIEIEYVRTVNILNDGFKHVPFVGDKIGVADWVF